MYEIGKILVFMTALPKGAAEPSSLGSGPLRARRVQVAAEHVVILQEIKRTIIRHCQQFVPAFLSLILPCLDPSREKSRGDTSALDVVLTLFKQVRFLCHDKNFFRLIFFSCANKCAQRLSSATPPLFGAAI